MHEETCAMFCAANVRPPAAAHAHVIVRPDLRKKDGKSWKSEASDLSIRRGTNKRARPLALARSTRLLLTFTK